MAKKSTKATVEQRIRVVYEMLLFDTPCTDIIRYGADNWNIKSRMVECYIQKANKLIVAEVAEMRQNSLEKHIAQRTLIAREALKDGDRRLTLDVLRDLAKLEGLYPSGKLDITTKDITNEQRITRINAILDNARDRRDRLAN